MTQQDDSGGAANWDVLKSFDGPLYAEMARTALEAAGIPCIIKKDFFGSAYGVQGTTHTGLETKLLVPRDRLNEGKRIIREMGIDED